MFYIISESYSPTSAITVRTLSLLKGLSELGAEGEWVVVNPDNKFSRWEHPYKGISIRYIWNSLLSRNTLCRRLYMIVSLLLFICFKLKKGDTVLLFHKEILHWLISKKDIRIYLDIGEHPKAYNISRFSFINDSFVDDCSKIEGLFVVSEALKEYFISENIPPERIHVVNMVVDSNRFKGINKDRSVEPYIAYCGNASNRKDGVDDLIRAFSLVAKQTSDLKLYIIGRAPSNESDNSKLVEELGLRDRIVFTGIVPFDEMPEYLTNSRMLALCRPESLQNTYGFPSKLGEYLLTGNPVVITSVGDVPLFLINKYSALLSPCGDINAFAENIMWIVKHYEEAQTIGERGREVALKRFNYLTEAKKEYNVIFSR